MLTDVRSMGALILALAATDADGSTLGRSATMTPDSARSAWVELDRDFPLSVLAFGPLVPRVSDAPLEQQACHERDKLRQLRGRIAPAVIRAASEQLNLPMGTGRFVAVQGRRYLFCLEPHYREPGTGPGPSGWHKGVTVYEAS